MSIGKHTSFSNTCETSVWSTFHQCDAYSSCSKLAQIAFLSQCVLAWQRVDSWQPSWIFLGEWWYCDTFENKFTPATNLKQKWTNILSDKTLFCSDPWFKKDPLQIFVVQKLLQFSSEPVEAAAIVPKVVGFASQRVRGICINKKHPVLNPDPRGFPRDPITETKNG